MLSDSGTPLSTRNNIVSPNSSISSMEESPVAVKPVTIRQIEDTPMEEEITSINDILRINLDNIKNQRQQEVHHESPQPQPRIQLVPRSKSTPQPIQQPIAQPIAQPIRQLTPQPIPPLKPRSTPKEIQLQILKQTTPKPQLKLTYPNFVQREPMLNHLTPKSSPRPEIIKSTQKQASTLDALELITPISNKIDDNDCDDDDDEKERPAFVESGFKLASNKPILLNQKAQRRVEYLIKQYATMEINLKEYEKEKQKPKPVLKTKSEVTQSPMKDISNITKPINSCINNMDTEDDLCDEADDEFLRNLDVKSLVGDHDLL